MGILGTVASLYMAVLIILLIISFGLIGLKFVNYILTLNYFDTKSGSNIMKLESNKIEVHKRLKAALYSFLGLIISFLLLTVLN